MADVLLLGNSATTASYSSTADRIYHYKYTAVKSGTLKSIRFYTGTAGDVMVGIYADSSGSPGAKIWGSGVVAASGSALNTVNCDDQTIVKDTVYWLSFVQDLTSIRYETSGGVGRYKSITFADYVWPDPAGSGYSSNTLNALISGWGAELATGRSQVIIL